MIFRIALLMLVSIAKASTAPIDKQTYIIHVDKAKVASSADTSKEWYEAVLDSVSELSAQDQEAKPTLLYVYKTAISGFAAKLSSRQLESLKQVNGFLSATPDEMLSLHTTHSPQFLGLETGKGLWESTNMNSDVIIGVLDSGIWPEHVSFHDTGMSAVPTRWKGTCESGTNFASTNCNKKLIGARYFFKGYVASGGTINETEEYKSARDAEGHGTHTASTAAGSLVEEANVFGFGKGLAGGMRYSSRIAAYKVCWIGGCSTSDILAAMDQAIADGVDVMSISLGGSDKPYYNDNMAIGSFRAIRNGIFVSCSAGNSGPYTSSVSNTAPWIMTVAASYLDRSFQTTLKLGNGQTFKGSSLYSGKAATRKLSIVYGKKAGNDDDAYYCLDDSLSTKLVKGKIVICERGMISRAEKGEIVKAAGGAGVIVLNDDNEGEDLLAEAFTLPGTSIGAAGGNAIRKYVSSTKTPSVSISFDGTVYGNTAPAMAAFSSRGPSEVGPEVIKPDVTAPGVNILAAWPPNISPTELKSDKRSVLFNIVSGTSMSCPHVSGIAALIKSIHKDWSPAAIKSALMTTAYVLDNTKKMPISDVSNSSTAATPFIFGSGHVDPERASDPGLIYDITGEDYLNHLCSLNYTSSEIAIFSGGTKFTCPKTKTPPGDLNYPSFAVNFNSKAKKNSDTFTRSVTNVGVPVGVYSVKVEEPKDVSVTVEPKALEFEKLGEKLTFKVSFVGRRKRTAGETSFGTLVWVYGKYTVRSPIAVTWS